MSEVRVGSFGFEYDAERHEMYVNRYFDAVVGEGEAVAMIDNVSEDAWEEFSLMLLERAFSSRLAGPELK